MAFQFRINGNSLDFPSVADAIALVGPILRLSSSSTTPERFARPSFTTAVLDLEAARTWQPSSLSAVRGRARRARENRSRRTGDLSRRTDA